MIPKLKKKITSLYIHLNFQKNIIIIINNYFQEQIQLRYYFCFEFKCIMNPQNKIFYLLYKNLNLSF